jgi:DNA polymerase II small subunit/DNA polymerase delta subunit B
MGRLLHTSGRQVYNVQTLLYSGKNFNDFEKSVAQFTVRTALACVQMPPREN